MIVYGTVGTNDLDRARAFYDKVTEPLGGTRTMEFGGRMQFYGGHGHNMFAVCTPYDGQRATVGNGSMFGLASPSRKAVDAAYNVAVANGAKCEGPPGNRTDNLYAAYFRDPDGNKICVFNMG